MKKYLQHKQLSDLLYVIIGSFILAIGINSVLVPNNLVAGGANGISVIINALFHINPGIILYAINIPLLILCYILLGKENGIKTTVGSLVYPFFVIITSPFPPLTHNVFLGSIFGAILIGVGLGLEFKGDGSTGGTAILAQVVNKYFKLSLGTSLLIIDGLIILGAALVFDMDTVLFSLICLFLIGRVIDLIQIGFIRSKNIMVITTKYDEVHHLLTQKLNKGVTLIPIEGGYSNAKGKLLMSVVYGKDFTSIKDQIQKIDSHAFIVSMQASEVYGLGFSLKKSAQLYGMEREHLQ